MAWITYLIHLEPKLVHAQHYVGTAKSLKKRLAQHHEGTGARMLAVCNERDIRYDVVRTWKFPTAMEARQWERQIKKRHGSGPLCPVCHARCMIKREHNSLNEATAQKNNR